MTVVVRGGSIFSIGGKARLTGKIIDGKGKYLIPGLWDMHVHLWEKRPMFGLYVANGVLGIRDMGSDLARTQRWRQMELAPWVFTSGAPVDGQPAGEKSKLPVHVAASPDQAWRAVDAIDGQKADFVKVMSTLSKDAYVALAQRARVTRVVFAGHVPESVTVTQALDARQKSMEHMFGLALACSSEEKELREQRTEAASNQDNAALARIRVRTYETFSEARATELFQRMARFDAWQTPTLTLRKRLSLMGLDNLARDARVKNIPEEIRSTWQDPREDLRKATPEQLDRFRRDYEFHEKLVGMMQKSGTGILAGTDTGDPYVLPGYALHDELELLVKAGLTPAQALRTATVNPARYFGISAGSIAKGKRADLVLLNANPLDNIRNTRNIHSVILRGQLLERKQLDRLLKEK
jgi:hypothetical protein